MEQKGNGVLPICLMWKSMRNVRNLQTECYKLINNYVDFLRVGTHVKVSCYFLILHEISNGHDIVFLLSGLNYDKCSMALYNVCFDLSSTNYQSTLG